MDGDTMYEQYLKDCEELEKYSAMKDSLRKLREDMSNSIGPVYNDKTRVWLKRIDKLLEGGE